MRTLPSIWGSDGLELSDGGVRVWGSEFAIGLRERDEEMLGEGREFYRRDGGFRNALRLGGNLCELRQESWEK